MTQPWLIVISGWTGAGKSSLADRLGAELPATVASFDWLMSGLRAAPVVWEAVELPVERQRRVGWNLLSRVAEQQLRRGASCVLDLVARDEPRVEWEHVVLGRERYIPLAEPKLVVDAVTPFEDNVTTVREHLGV